MTAAHDLHCVDVVGRASAYLNGTVDPRLRGRLEEHVAGCVGCSAYLDQFGEVVRLLARLPPEAPSEERRRELERLLGGAPEG